MFKTDNTKIGNYLAALIKNSRYKNDRQFSIAYLTLRDGAEWCEWRRRRCRNTALSSTGPGGSPFL